MNTDGSNPQAVGIINNAYLTYASLNNLYTVQNSGGWWWQPDSGVQRQHSAVYKFAIGDGAPSYRAMGRIDGWLRNSFSLGEYETVLHTATTERNWITDIQRTSWVTQNHLINLRESSLGELQVIGESRGFGKDETIQSARFLGTRGFIVTFRQIDPLFSFDLTEPTAPKLLGSLEIPGFSSYMHPLDDTYLLTIGRSGAGNNFQLQIFDVSDMAKPKQAFVYSPSEDGYSYSAAEYDHKAFTYYAPSKLLTIPVSQGYYSGAAFSGILAFRVDVNAVEKIRLLGGVNHGDLAVEYFCGPAGVDNLNCRSYFYYVIPNRSVIMADGLNDYLYSISDIGIKANLVTDSQGLPQLNLLLFPSQAPNPITIIDPLPLGNVVF